MPADREDLRARNLGGLDALDTFVAPTESWQGRTWAAAWPKMLAVFIVVAGWQIVFWSGWRAPWVLPPPAPVFAELWDLIRTNDFHRAFGITMQRAFVGFASAIGIGMLIGMAVSQSWTLRRAIGSMITGLQSMPSITWFPLAILLFGLSDTAILFVVVLGAAPSVANGLISGVDQVPPVLRRAGQVLGASGPQMWRFVVLPAILPAFVAGLKQGWAFAWRSLMAGELLVGIPQRPSLGLRLRYAGDLQQTEVLIALMIVVLFIGIVIDGLVFGQVERRLLRNRGLLVGKQGSLGS